MLKIILASNSKVRKKILDENSIESEVFPSNVDEDSVKESMLKENMGPEQISKNLAELKANKVSLKFNSDIVIGADSVIDINGESWIKMKNLVTLGPFEMIEKKNNSYMIFKDKSGKKIKITINENSTSSLAMFENGQLDILDGGGIPLLEIPYLQSKGIINTNNQFRNNYIGFNVNKKPFDDPEIRRAFMLAINKEIFESILQNTVSATNSWIPKGMIGNNKYINLYDPKKAKDSVEEMCKKLLANLVIENYKIIDA